MDAPSYAAAAELAPPMDVDVIQTAGYRKAGLGGAHYAASETPGPGPFRFRTANGRWFELSEPRPSAEMFGAAGDGVSDDSDAVSAAIGFSKARGLCVDLTQPVYRFNIVLTGRGNCLAHNALSQGGTTVPSSVRPFDQTRPAVQIGDGRTNTDAVRIENLSLRGRAGDKKGLLVDGANSIFFTNLSAAGFEQYGLMFTSTASQPTFFVHIDGCYVSPGNTAGAKGAVLDYGASFTTSVYFDHCGFRSSGPKHGFIIDVLGRASGALSNSYFDGSNGATLHFSGPGWLNASNTTVDSPKSTDILLNYDDRGSPADHLRGGVMMDGRFANLDGPNSTPLSGWNLGSQELVDTLRLRRELQLEDRSQPQTQKDAPSPRGAAIFGQAGRLILKNGAGPIVLAPGPGGVQIQDPSGGANVLRLGGGALWASGFGSPEGRQPAPVGSLYSRLDGGAGTALYVKEKGTGSVGWVPK